MIRHLPSMDMLYRRLSATMSAGTGKVTRAESRARTSAFSKMSCDCGCFDAMTTNRSYRKALPVEYAAEEIIKNAGTQFDPSLPAYLQI